MLDFFRKKSKQVYGYAGPHNFMQAVKPEVGSQRSEVGTVISTDTSVFGKVSRACLYLLVFAVPFLFLPWTSEVLDFNKQALVFLGTALMLILWVLKVLISRRASWMRTSLDYILLAYLAVYLISSLTSIDKVSSFMGYYSRFTGSFISILSLVLFYFLVVNQGLAEKHIRRISNWLAAGMGLVLFYSLAQLLGWFILPAAFTHSRSFNPLGSLVSLGIFAAISIIYAQWLLLTGEDRRKTFRGFLGLVTLAGLIILFLVNGFAAWLVLALGLAVLLSLAMAERESGSLWKPMVILILAVLFVAFQFLPPVLNPRNLVNINLPVEIQLSNATTWNMVQNSLGSGAKKAILGSGPGTTGIAFGHIRPQELNKTIVWSLNFDRASSEVANITIETGILGLLAFELASILFLFYGLFYLLKKASPAARNWAFGFYLIWLCLYIAHFFYFLNFTFYFLFWASLGLFMAVVHMRDSEPSSSMSPSSSLSLSWVFTSLLALAVILVGVFFQAAIFGSEVTYANGIKELGKDKPNLAAASASFGRALTLNPYRDAYYLAYGQSLILLAQQETGKDKPDTAKIQSYLADLITAGQKAVQLSPEKSGNWQALSQFYSTIRTLVTGADKYVIASLQQALERDPTNPTLHYQLAQAYLAAASAPDPALTQGPDADSDNLSDALEAKIGSDPRNADTNHNNIPDGTEVQNGLNPVGTGQLTAQQTASFTKTDGEMIKNAETELNKAIELKPDLPEFYIQLARLLERMEKPEEAKKKLDEAVVLFRTNADVLFEDGRLTFNLHNLDDAEKLFANVLQLQPNYANAYYSLGLIYQQRGDKAKALAAFEKTREIVGANPDLDKLIEQLKK